MRSIGSLVSLASVLSVFSLSLVGCAGGMKESGPSGGYPGSAGYPSAPYAAGESVAGATAMAEAAPPAAPAPPSPSSKADSSSAPKREAEAPIAKEAAIHGGLLTAGVWDDGRNFDFFLGFTRKLSERGSDFAIFSDAELARARANQNQAQSGAKQALDVAIVFDTTGSMGDELGYLQREVESIAARLHEKLPTIEPRWSLVVYRDRSDDYVARSFDFTPKVSKFRRTLAEQSANGGGDYPEAVVQGLRATDGLGWRRENGVAKVAFWIADAPSHEGEGKAFGNVVRSITQLDRAIVRMLEIEVSGKHVPVADREVIRSVGSPQADGTCKLANGDLVAAY